MEEVESYPSTQFSDHARLLYCIRQFLTSGNLSRPTISDISEIEEMPHNAPIVPKHYGYSTDSLWEIMMCIDFAREIRQNHMSHIRSPAISEEAAVTYLLDIPESIFKLHIKSTKYCTVVPSVMVRVVSGHFGKHPRERISQSTSETAYRLMIWIIMTRQNGTTK